MAVRRLFFALWPDAPQRRACREAYGPILAAARGRPVAADNLHVTLEFLGAVPDSSLDVLAALGVAVVLPEDSLVFDRIECWRRAASLVAVPSAVATGLVATQGTLRDALKERGFRVDSRPFRPHLTLARKVVAPPPTVPDTRVEWRIAELALVESAPGAQGSRYVPLARWPRGVARTDFAEL